MVWDIRDRHTGRLSTEASFLTREQAEWQITNWRDRHERGGRPDITLDKLLNMEPVERHAPRQEPSDVRMDD